MAVVPPTLSLAVSSVGVELEELVSVVVAVRAERMAVEQDIDVQIEQDVVAAFHDKLAVDAEDQEEIG